MSEIAKALPPVLFLQPLLLFWHESQYWAVFLLYVT